MRVNEIIERVYDMFGEDKEAEEEFEQDMKAEGYIMDMEAKADYDEEQEELLATQLAALDYKNEKTN